MSFRLVPKSVTLNDLERRNGVILRCFSEFGYLPGSRSLSHLLMSSCSMYGHLASDEFFFDVDAFVSFRVFYMCFGVFSDAFYVCSVLSSLLRKAF